MHARTHARAQVLARSSPEDKLTLVSLLKQEGEVVAVTGARARSHNPPTHVCDRMPSAHGFVLRACA
jgi:hypothetical protein